MSREWFIRKSGAFYRPNRAGYTYWAVQAGLYTEDEAKTEARVEDTITAHHASEWADEIAKARADVERFDFLKTA